MKKIRNYLIALPRPVKQLVMIGGDVVGATLAIALAMLLQSVSAGVAMQPWWQVPLVLLVAVACAARCGLYSAVIRYIGLRAAVKILLAALGSAALLYLASAVLMAPLLQPFVIADFAAYLVLMLAASRMLARHALGTSSDSDAKRFVIYGAGEAGAQLAHTLASDRRRRAVAFLDDSSALEGAMVADLRVHAPAALPDLVKRKKVSGVLLAMPGATRRRKQEIIKWLEPLPVTVKTIPSLSDIVSGEAEIGDVRNVDIEDLLGRDPVPPDPVLLGQSIAGKTVLVTGAGGSIGSELCRQIVAQKPKHLVLLDVCESVLFQIDRELSIWAAKTGAQVRITPVLGNILNQNLVGASIRRFGVNTLFHAAAYKHVPLVEYNVNAGLRNNVIGTRNVAEAAASHGVERFILISTDKAVRPTNVMGATKRVAEQVVQGFAARAREPGGSGCVFSMVRFGNVLGSSGSVVPTFREQVRNGGPVTVTHPEITRYFMTIPEAAQLVIQAGAMAKGGEVFVLDMGEPVKIVDLARRMIRLAGRSVCDDVNPRGEVKIAFSGLRPGEKLYEELLIASSSIDTGHSKIGCAEERAMPWPQLELLLQKMDHATTSYQRGEMKGLLQQAVPEYVASEQDYDAICAAGDEDDLPADRDAKSNVVPLQ